MHNAGGELPRIHILREWVNDTDSTCELLGSQLFNLSTEGMRPKEVHAALQVLLVTVTIAGTDQRLASVDRAELPTVLVVSILVNLEVTQADDTGNLLGYRTV